MAREIVRYTISATSSAIVLTGTNGSTITTQYAGIACWVDGVNVVLSEGTTETANIYYKYFTNDVYKTPQEVVKFINELIEENYAGSQSPYVFPITTGYMPYWNGTDLVDSYLQRTGSGTITDSGKYIGWQNGSNSYIVGLQSGVTAQNTIYTLPTDFPAVSGYVLSSNTSGVMSWVANPSVSVVSNNYLPVSNGTDYVNSYLSQDTNGIIVDSGKRIQGAGLTCWIAFPANRVTMRGTDGISLNYITVNDSATGIAFVVDDGTSSASLDLKTGRALISGTDPAFQGFQGDADYSANYDSLSYVQKTYVDTIAGAYLPLSGNTALTPITGDVYFADIASNIRIDDTGSGMFNFLVSTGLSSIVVTETAGVQKAGVYVSSTSPAAYLDVFNAAGDESNIIITPSKGIVNSTYATFEGVTYGADYSANYTTRSLVDKGYVDTAVAAASPPAAKLFNYYNFI